MLPGPVQVVAHGIPASHVFEGMRGVIAGGSFPTGQLVQAALLDVAYLAVAWFIFRWVFAVVRNRCLIARFGE